MSVFLVKRMKTAMALTLVMSVIFSFVATTRAANSNSQQVSQKGFKPRTSVSFYENINLEGQKRFFSGVGKIDLSTFNDLASSIKVYKGYDLLVYDYVGLSGRVLVLEGPTSKNTSYNSYKNLIKYGFNDIASSFKVIKKGSSKLPSSYWGARRDASVIFYENVNFDGQNRSFHGKGSGEIDSFNDTTSSIKVKRGYVLYAYEDTGLSGRCVRFKGPSLGDKKEYKTYSDIRDIGLNDKITSFKVVKLIKR